MGKREKKPIVVAHIMGKWVGGGVESVVMNYYRNIDRNKIQFDFICDSDSTCVPVKEIEAMGGNVIFVPPYQKLIPYMKELKKIFKQKKYKILQSHINTLSVFPLSVAKSVGIPIRIAHSHSTTNIREFNKNFLKILLRPFSKLYANQYFICGELSGKFLFGKDIYKSDKMYYMRNAIDLDKYKYDEKIRKIYRKKYNIKDDYIVFGHVGRFVTQKNHKFLIKVFNEIYKKNNKILLFLVGCGPLEKIIKSKVQKLGLEDNVIFLGQRNDVSNLYQMFDILILPSLYEGLSVVGIEAQVSGLLCVFSNSITSELKLMDSTMFISLNKKPKIWADLILNNYLEYDRIKNNKFIDYDLKAEAINLENKYIDLIEE